MKKKIITLILSVVMLLTILPLGVFADAPTGERGEYVCGDYEYNIISEEEKTCKIVNYTGLTDAEKIVVPQILDGYKVISIGGTTFWSKPIKKVVIQEGVKAIEDNAFVWSGDGEYIEDVWHSLTEITIPNSVTYIGEKTFFCHMIGRIYGYSGSYAETYVNENMSCDFIPLNVANNTENDITVVFDNENVYDKNMVVNVDTLDVQDNSIVYDITLTVDGVEVQPENSVAVKIPVPETMDADNIKVFREETDGTYTDMNAVMEEGYAVFSTEHFSKYILTTEDLNKSVGPEEDKKEPEQEEDKNTNNTDKNENNDNLVTDVEIPNTDYNTSVTPVFVAMAISGMALIGLKKRK